MFGITIPAMAKEPYFSMGILGTIASVSLILTASIGLVLAIAAFSRTRRPEVCPSTLCAIRARGALPLYFTDSLAHGYSRPGGLSRAPRDPSIPQRRPKSSEPS